MQPLVAGCVRQKCGHVLPSFLTSPARHRVVVLRLRVCYMLTAPLLSLVCRLARWRPCSDDGGHSICWGGKSNGHRQQVQTTRRQCLLWFFKSDPTRKHFFCKRRSLRVNGSTSPRVQRATVSKGPRVQGSIEIRLGSTPVRGFTVAGVTVRWRIGVYRIRKGSSFCCGGRVLSMGLNWCRAITR